MTLQFDFKGSVFEVTNVKAEGQNTQSTRA
jgi:hypothetical protein